MKQIEIVKDYKLLKPGNVINVEDAYAEILVKKGVAKVVGEASKPEKVGK